MANRFTEFLGRSAIGVFSVIGLAGLTFVVLDGRREEEKKRHALLDRIAQSDVTKDVCPSKEAVSARLPLTLAPLMFMKDRVLDKTGEDLLRDATKHSLSFAFCPLAQGTTSFEVAQLAGGGHSNVLKISDFATAPQQQAAVLQFLKEYKMGSVSISYNNVVQADAKLAASMPGRLPPDADVKYYDLKQFGNTYAIPAR